MTTSKLAQLVELLQEFRDDLTERPSMYRLCGVRWVKAQDHLNHTIINTKKALTSGEFVPLNVVYP